MDPLKPISIIGGGLAGLALGIGLRQRSVPVSILEAGRFPRHRVCGEFISGRGQEVLSRLGLLEWLTDAGARTATTTAFFSGSHAFPARHLPQPALCLSRFTLDTMLARRFGELGGELKCETRWPESDPGDGVVRASGRRSQATEVGWRWFGLKAHARDVWLSADLEMHLSNGAYVGLCRLSDQVVNVCGLFRGGREETNGGKSVVERLSGIPKSVLRERLKNASWDPDSTCAVAGLSLRPRFAEETRECRIGDALTMIAPVTGNGMSMAFESAELATDPLLVYSQGRSSWEQTTAIVAQRCDALFARRLRWAWRLQRGLFTPAIRRTLLPVAMRSRLVWRFLFEVTR